MRLAVGLLGAVGVLSLLAHSPVLQRLLEPVNLLLAQIVEYVDQLAQVDTEDVEPMAHALERVNVFRGDDVKASLPRDDALANAPHHDDRGYLVPAVLGE